MVSRHRRLGMGACAALVIIASGTGVSACSGDGGAGAPATPDAGAKIQGFPFTYKFYVNDGDKRTRVQVVPQEVANRLSEQPASGASVKTSGLRPLATPAATSGESIPLTISPTDLVAAAARECGMIGDGAQDASNPTGPYVSDPALQDIVTQEQNAEFITSESPCPPWLYRYNTDHPFRCYYVFPAEPRSCDAVLEYSQTAVCMADKLAQLADTIVPLEWHGGSLGFDVDGKPNANTWTMPPPSEQEKFILRDIATSVLAQVPLLDAYPISQNAALAGHPVAVTGSTCSALYASYDRLAAPDANSDIALFGASPIPAKTYPPRPDPASARTIAQERLAFEANVLRTAGQLLHDLVRESVYSDLAGSAARSAATADPLGGQAMAYGLQGNTPYNSLAHVARTLFGRWEMDELAPDPQCHGVAELDLFSKLADVGTQARANDLGAVTTSQATAETLFEEAGIVLVDGATADLASVLVTQLLGIKGAVVGLTGDQFKTTPGGRAIAQLVAPLSPSDLARSAQHNRTTFSLLTESKTTDAAAIASAVAGAGFTQSTIANPGLAGMGIALANGLSRGSVATDAMARTGAVASASQCGESAGLAAADLDDLVASTVVWTLPNQPVTLPAQLTRQDVFAVAQSLRSRLVKLREQADGAAPATSSSSKDAQSRAAAVAELGAWAGAGRAILSTNIGDQSRVDVAPTQMFLDLVGVTPADFGVGQLSELQGVLSLVMGDARLAECQAGLASSCNPTQLAAAVLKPTSVTFDSFGAGSPDQTTPQGQSTLRSRYGATGGFARLTFPSNGLGGPFYLVSSTSPDTRSAGGEILATLAQPVTTFDVHFHLSYTGGESSATLSPMRRELVQDAFALGHWVGAAPPHAGDLPISGTPSFCIEGVRRDMFVPLENDLTNQSDNYENSWSYYLNAAQAAAQRADEIGQTMVDVGFQKTTAVENAAEQLQTTIGCPTNVDKMSIDPNGKIAPGDVNGCLGSVLNAPKISAVFLTADPLGCLDPGDTGGACTASNPAPPQCPTGHAMPTPSQLAKALGCDANPKNPICGTLGQTGATVQPIVAACAAAYVPPAPTSRVVTYTALNLTPPAQKKSSANCARFVAGAGSLKGLNIGFGDGKPAPGSKDPPPTVFNPGPITYQTAQTYNPDLLTAGLGSWGTDSLGIRGTFQNVRMVVRDDASWTVTVSGSPVMNSTPGSQWPGCLAAGQKCDWTNPLVASLNDVFRWCAPGQDLQGTALGACEGDAPETEVNSLRWRVEGALWLAAMMSGGIPNGMFTSPIPAANSSPNPIPLNMYFDDAAFDVISGNRVAFAGGPTGHESDLLKDMNAVTVDATSAWFKWSAKAAAVVPKWLLDVYTAGHDGAPLVHLTGTTPDGNANFVNLDPFFTDYLKTNGVHDASGNSPDIVGAVQWKALANTMTGLQCASPYDPPTAGAEMHASFSFGAAWMQGLVAAMKTELKADSSMERPFWQGLNNIIDQYPFCSAPDCHGSPGGLERVYWWNNSAGGRPSPPSFGQNTSTAHSQAFDPGPAAWFQQTPLTWACFESRNCPATPPSDHGAHYPTMDYMPLNWSSVSAEYRNFDYWRLLGNLGPNERVRFALNSKAPNGECGAAWELTEAIALSCVLDQDVAGNLTGQLDPPPDLRNLDDLAQLSIWLQQQLRTASATLQNAFAEDVPAVVVAAARATPGSLAGLGGPTATDINGAATALMDVYMQVNLLMGSAQHIADSIDQTRTAIAHAQNVATTQDIQAQIQSLATLKAIAEDTAQIAQGAGSFVNGFKGQFGNFASGSAEATAGAAALVTDGMTLSLITDLEKANHQDEANAIRLALIGLHDTAVAETTAMSNQLITAREDVGTMTQDDEAFASQQSQAAYYAGKASGVDIWDCGTSGASVECVSHVNTVLNRRYLGEKIRYDNALREAKALGYIARVAIEQRIGRRLSEITEKVGPLDPPATWADDVCHMTGINYQRLQAELVGLDAGKAAIAAADQKVAGEFADAFIGDYVQKLADFVQYYNVAYPEADGNDQSVLSLRETLLGGQASCSQPSPNLLTDSSRLFATGSERGAATSGWMLGMCTGDPSCLLVSAAAGAVPAEAGAGGISWLHDQTSATSADAGAPSFTPSGPDNVVSQAVRIDTPGTYVLSWWDQARDPVTGAPSTGTPTAKYSVVVYDSAWNPLQAYVGLPATTDAAGATWSPRHALSFTMASPDIVYVAFAASTIGASPGSVGIADPQLERMPPSHQPSAYVETGSSGMTVAYQCALTPGQFRAGFQRSCDADGTCHYDLETPITINTRDFTSNGMPLAGKLAAGNFNYRHLDVALNVVGTGVIDCSQTSSPDCFGSGYVTYTLTDDGSQVGVLGFDGQYRPFNFGVGTISGGKALTTERYITTPIGSSDQQLLGQIQRPELRGRPLDGTYTLRIADSPVLHFDQIQDIQFILSYRYWSRVSGPQNATSN